MAAWIEASLDRRMLTENRFFYLTIEPANITKLELRFLEVDGVVKVKEEWQPWSQLLLVEVELVVIGTERLWNQIIQK